MGLTSSDMSLFSSGEPIELTDSIRFTANVTREHFPPLCLKKTQNIVYTAPKLHSTFFPSMFFTSWILLPVTASFETKDNISRTQSPYHRYEAIIQRGSFAEGANAPVCTYGDFPRASPIPYR